MIEFVKSIIAGVFASLLIVFLIERTKKNKESRFFRKFIGYYDVLDIDDNIVKGELIEFTYKGAKDFKAQSKKNGDTIWESSIAMSPSNPRRGEGVYSCLKWHEVGTHIIEISPDDKKIFVHYRTLSHSNGSYGGVFWKKRQVTLPPTTGRVGRLMVDVGQ